MLWGVLPMPGQTTKWRKKLTALQQANPLQPQFLRCLAECEASLARLAGNGDRDEAAKALEQARATYKQLATTHRDDANLQIDWLESEWASAKMNGFDSGQQQLARVAQIKRAMPNTWPSNPNALYRLACYLTRREPTLMEPLQADGPKH